MIATGLKILGGILLGLGALAAAIIVAKIAYDAIKDWIDESVDAYPDADSVELLKENLANGNYRVVAGIFKNGIEMESQTWEGEELDAELAAQFGNKNKIVIDLTAA